MSAQKSEHPQATSTPIDYRRADPEPLAPSAVYYAQSHAPRKVRSSRTYSDAKLPPLDDTSSSQASPNRKRRASQDPKSTVARQLEINVGPVKAILLDAEDTDGNIQITVEDKGPKAIRIPTAGHVAYEIRNTYQLSNLLQELCLAQKMGRKTIVLDVARLNENPVQRFERLVKQDFWTNLTRSIDGHNIFEVAKDSKVVGPPRIYVPVGRPDLLQYYKRIAAANPSADPMMRLDVRSLDKNCGDAEYVRNLNKAPGLLAIEMKRIEDTPNGELDFEGLPFVVPGGRFNELYGWDSYMETLGLLLSDRVDLCENMVRHFCFCIRHYGKILNANRTYYLCRSQPPFLTDMALRVYAHIEGQPHALEFLRTAIMAAIKDYYQTWMSEPRYDEASGLSCYHPGGVGVPPETEPSHFAGLLKPFHEKLGISFEEYVEKYNYGKVQEPFLDDYFMHDRAVRESGHDTTYRLEGNGAHLATVDLNSCLYKYEADIARVIRVFFNNRLVIPAEWRAKGQESVETSATWTRKANKRRNTMDRLMWSEKEHMFFDYDTMKKEQTGYKSATTFWALWAGVASEKQAVEMKDIALKHFEQFGGLAASTAESREAAKKNSGLLHAPNRQWDWPFGWAPQQILAWTGFERYGFHDVAARLAYRWLYMCTKAFVDYNGVVVEKYDVVTKVRSHVVTAEYGNQGSEFEGVATEGFGWVNASYIYGLQFINREMKRCIGCLVPWDSYHKALQAKSPKQKKEILEQEAVHGGDGKVRLAEHVKRTGTGLETVKEGNTPPPSPPVKHSALPNSHEDTAGHEATYGSAERKEHHAPDVVVVS